MTQDFKRNFNSFPLMKKKISDLSYRDKEIPQLRKSRG